MPSADFNSKLTAFQEWANGINPDFGRQVSDVVAANYISQLGDAQSGAAATVGKLGSLIDTLGSTYLKSAEAYYLAKGKVADLKLASKGSLYTQVANAGYGATSLPPTNLLLFGGLGLVAILMLSRR